jgi:N-acetylmuramoyl-L-alanine amidase
MKKLLVILDPAHGEEVPGKRSPDGKHREYKWSRERLRELAPKLEALGYTVVWTNTTEKEIGLSARKNAGSLLAKQHPDLIPFLLSLHNDASGNGMQWMQASGISVWTSKGRTTSDIFADYFIQAFKEVIPEVKHRQYSPEYLQRDYEDNFTVLMGGYSANLVECMFQDNRDDVELLSDPAFNAKVVEALVKGFELSNNYINSKK